MPVTTTLRWGASCFPLPAAWQTALLLDLRDLCSAQREE